MKTELGIEIIVPYLRFMHGVFFTTEVVKRKKNNQDDEFQAIIQDNPEGFMSLFKDIMQPTIEKIHEIYSLKKQAVLNRKEQSES